VKYVANKNNKANDNKLKLFTLLVFLCTSNDVYAVDPSCIKELSVLDVLFNEKMLFFLILAIFIVNLIGKSYADKADKKKREELSNIGIEKIEQRERTQREEFKRLEKEFEQLRMNQNVKVPTTPEEEADLNKTVVLSKIVLDIDPARMEKLVSKTGAVADDDTSNNVAIAGEIVETVNVNVKTDEVNEVQNDEVEPEEDNKTINDVQKELIEETEQLEETEVQEDSLDGNVRKIGKNIKGVLDKTIELKKREIYDLIVCVHENLYDKEFSKTVIREFVKDYVSAKYMKQIEFASKNAKDLRKNVNLELEKTTRRLIANVHRNYTDDYIRLVSEIVLMINKMDNMDNNIDKVVYDCKNLEIISKEELAKKLNAIYKSYYKIYSDYLKKLEIDKFRLVTNKLDTNGLFEPGNLVMTNISSSIQFSKIFSDYIIDKTYASEIVLEDLREVQLKFISFNVLEDMLRFNYKKKYIISFPVSLFRKEKKIQSLLNAIGDNYSQNKVFILIDLETLKEYDEIVLKLKRQGYKFIVQLTSDNIRIYDDLKKKLSLVEYIVYVGQRIGKAAMKECVPSYLLKKIIYVDKSLVEGVVIK